MDEVDVAIVGAGGGGLNLLVELDRVAARRGITPPTVALIDPVTRVGPDRTWCFWDAGRSDLDPAVTRSWNRVALIDRAGRSRTLDLHPLRYAMIGSKDFYALAEQSARRIAAVRVSAPALAVTDGPELATVTTDAGTVRARWVFDSRPVDPHRPPRTSWLQHFRGWTVRFADPVLDPDQAVLMDFSVPPAYPSHPSHPSRPGHPGLAGGEPAVTFGYLLPTSADRALLEYTVFSRHRLPDAGYDAGLHAYLAARWPGVDPTTVTVEAVEDGAIPMTDAAHARRVGQRVFRLGTAGGATRGSTGYTFAAMQRQARAVAEQLVTGAGDAVPVPPPAYPARHRWMDAVLLRALDRGLVDGPDLFVRMFERNPAERVLRFLDAGTSPREDLAVMFSAPVLAMTRAATQDAVARLRDRIAAPPRPA